MGHDKAKPETETEPKPKAVTKPKVEPETMERVHYPDEDDYILIPKTKPENEPKIIVRR